MAIKKKHHYLPKFYLKRFSLNKEGKFISLYNHKKEIFIKKAPLRHQGCKSFLYGNDTEIEDCLARMESDIARLFNHWIDKKLLYPPPSDSNFFKLLKKFILYQSHRIPKAGNNLEVSLNEGFKTIAKELFPEISKQFEGNKIVNPYSTLLMLLNAIKYNNLLDYLDCKLIVNLSELSLVMSDAPVIFYNQLLEAADNYIGATAPVAKGLQIFMPIHPRLLICLYDSEVYELGNGVKNCCSIESIEEIHQLNALQFINSEFQLFFDETISESYITYLCNEFSSLKHNKRNISSLIQTDTKKYFFTAFEDPKINLNLQMFKLLVNPDKYKIEICPLRHPSLEKKI